MTAPIKTERTEDGGIVYTFTDTEARDRWLHDYFPKRKGGDIPGVYTVEPQSFGRPGGSFRVFLETVTFYPD